MNNIQPKKLSLVHLVRAPQKDSDGAPPLLILLHGLGSNEQDLFSMAGYLDPRFMIISVRAPYSMGFGGYAWFELDIQPGNSIRVNVPQAMKSVNLISQFISEATTAYGADPEQVYLMGFSQGAIMSAAVTLTRPELVAGAVLMSGRIGPEMIPAMATPEQLRNKPFLVVHGTYDPVLSIENGRASRDLLEKLPVNLTYKEYPMAHEVSQESLLDIIDWLKARLDEK